MVAFVASRLGRRPKRLKNLSSSESSNSKCSVPVKPRAVVSPPSHLGLLPLSMAELEVSLSHCNTYIYNKGSPYSITEHRVPELIPVLGSQPAGDVSHKPGGRLPLLNYRA